MKVTKVYDTDSDNCVGGACFDDGARLWWNDTFIIVDRPDENMLVWAGSKRLEPPDNWEGKQWMDVLDRDWYDESMVFTTEMSYNEVENKIRNIIKPKDENCNS